MGGYLPDSSQDLLLKTHRPRIIWMDSIAINFLFFPVQLCFFLGGSLLRWSNRDPAAGEFKQLTEKRAAVSPGPVGQGDFLFDVVYGWWMGKWIKMMCFTQTVDDSWEKCLGVQGEKWRTCSSYACFLLFSAVFFPAHFVGEKQHGDITAIASYAPRYHDGGLFGRWFFGGIKRPGLVQGRSCFNLVCPFEQLSRPSNCVRLGTSHSQSIVSTGTWRVRIR